MKKFLLILAILAAIIFVIFALTGRQGQPTSDSGKITIITTLFPLFDMARDIGGSDVQVTLMLPPGVEAHAFEPTPSDIVKINTADIFVYTGKFMEPWVEDILKGVTNKNLIIVDSSAGISINEQTGDQIDPHIWLDFDNAKMMAENIEQALAKKSPNNIDYYALQLQNYSSELDSLDNQYKTELTNCKTNQIIYGGHYAFGYLARRYDLKYSALQGVSPDAEPTAQDLVRLVEEIKISDIKYIFYEELASPKLAQTIARETGAKLLLLNAAHNITRDQLAAGVSFFDLMRANLDNLKIGLECQTK
ncbi:MAG: hypothetical protein A2445_04980 [Candidatus Jacksonbacteria bacterium RIFOXYC2_FULL_44_29]|nr:MAG: ABC-type metal ion transport system, periplasmic component [Parcubacteria group bacterium GW2011_GWC2_44_22]OGY76616.1 MAG: hypothetical protein A2240_01405 [Candidatus Jacksonbacteria bacterium RIFOXYA2_FULL_43_12]OGY77494.1 MAG: hypothetical protein A2295_00650 [Candidatus Jacksonbacteria bacterium RIFOXYB2_FULL_44_15]OGY79215.1 MAG: hypothetical protein A2550_03685 [Candidatus Jacksonbacteria bacterium RIFOXYD2_FULL_43_21]OGY80889.1 MAG: hypothetical protein A2445_04980 [Candidatus J